MDGSMIMRVWKQGYNKDVVQGKTHTLSFSLMFDNFQTSSNSTSCAHMYVAHDKHVYNYIARKSLDTENYYIHNNGHQVPSLANRQWWRLFLS